MRLRGRVGPLVLASASVLLGGCDAWERFTDWLARIVALAFLLVLVPFAVGGGAGLYVSLRRAPAVASVVVAWALAVSAGFVIGVLDQFLPDVQRHATWAAALPVLGLPTAAWAVIGSARLMRARGLPVWSVAIPGVVAAGYCGWLAMIVGRGFRWIDP